MIKIGFSDFLGYKDSPFDWFEIDERGFIREKTL